MVISGSSPASFTTKQVASSAENSCPCRRNRARSPRAGEARPAPPGAGPAASGSTLAGRRRTGACGVAVSQSRFHGPSPAMISKAFMTAAATLEPPLRPRLVMKGSSGSPPSRASRSLLSAAPTKPTGRPTISFGSHPLLADQADQLEKSGWRVADDEDAVTGRAAPLRMATMERVIRRALASFATCGSATKQDAVPNGPAAPCRSLSAMVVSVTMPRPAAAPRSRADRVRGKKERAGIFEIGAGVDGAPHDRPLGGGPCGVPLPPR